MVSQRPSIDEYVKNRDYLLNKAESDLLKAALLSSEKAICFWNRWRSKVPFEDIDPGSQKLIPLLYQNLTDLGVEEPIIAKYKGVYRRTWVENQFALQKLIPVLQSFHDADITSIILKGGAMMAGYYQNPGLRPIDEIELLIPTNRATYAVSKLSALGWRCEDGGSLESKPDFYFSSRTAQRFSTQDGRKIKIRWRLSLIKGDGIIDADHWQHASETQINGKKVYIYQPTEQLIDVCVYSLWGDSGAKIQMIADAARIINQSSSDIDWDLITHTTKKQRLLLPVLETLSVLAVLLDAPIPPDLLKQIEGMEVSTTEVKEHQIRVRASGLLGSLPIDWFNYLRLTQDELELPLRPAVVGFPDYLKDKWDSDNIWNLSIEAGRKGIRRIRRRLG